MFPLFAVVAFAVALRASWKTTGSGALIWTASDSLSRTEPVIARGCNILGRPSNDQSRRRDTWVVPASLWPLVKWRVTWLPRSRSSIDLLFVPTNHYLPFSPSYVIQGRGVPVAAQLSSPGAAFLAVGGESWLLVRDTDAAREYCGPSLGAIRRIDRQPTPPRGVRPTEWQFIRTPGGVAYGAWKETSRILTGIAIGAVVALLILTAGAAHFWAAGQARGWAVARLCGASWPLLRWQVAGETVWLLGPGISVGTLVGGIGLGALLPALRLPAPSRAVLVGTPVAIFTTLLLTLALLLWGRMRSLSPMEGLREAREWRG